MRWRSTKLYLGQGPSGGVMYGHAVLKAFTTSGALLAPSAPLIFRQTISPKWRVPDFFRCSNMSFNWTLLMAFCTATERAHAVLKAPPLYAGKVKNCLQLKTQTPFILKYRFISHIFAKKQHETAFFQIKLLEKLTHFLPLARCLIWSEVRVSGMPFSLMMYISLMST